MKIFRKALLLTTLALLLTATPYLAAQEAQDNTIDVLYVGQSHNTSRDVLRSILPGQGQPVHYRSLSIAGAPIRWFYGHVEREGPDFKRPSKWLKSGSDRDEEPFDYFVISHYSSVGENDVAAMVGYANMAYEANPDIVIQLNTDWPKRFVADKMAWARDYQTDTAEAVAAVDEALPDDANPVRLAPRGVALADLIARVVDGQIPGLATKGDIYWDGGHMSGMGHYLNALVEYSTMTGRRPADTPNQFGPEDGDGYHNGVLTDQQVKAYNRIAWKAIQDEPLSRVEREIGGQDTYLLDKKPAFYKSACIMPRLARVIAVGHPYHVTHRGNRRDDVFFDDRQRQ